MLKLLLTSYFIFTATISFAGTCCGGGSSNAQLMLGQTKSVWRTKYSDKTITADSSSKDIIYRVNSDTETIRTLSFSSSFRLSDLWQIGINIPIVEKIKKLNNNWESTSGIGDLQLNMGYEFFPEYSREQFITQGFLFFQTTLPTSPSLFTTKRDDLLDTRGSGHYKYAAGTILTKRFPFGVTILQASLEYMPGQDFKRSIFSEETIKTRSSLNNLMSLGQSYYFAQNFSGNIGISRAFTEKKISSTLSNENKSSTLSSTNIGLSYSHKSYSYSLSYIDDFLIHNSENHILGKSLSIGLTRRVDL